MKFRAVFWLALSLAAGIVAGFRWDQTIPLLFPLLGFGVFFVCLSLFFITAQKPFWIFLGLGIFFLGQALCRYHLNLVHKDFPVGWTTLEGTVDSFPSEVRSSFGRKNVRFYLESSRFRGSNDRWKNIRMKFLVRLPAGSQTIRYGDRLVLQGHADRAPIAKNPGGFNVRSYLERRGIGFLLTVQKVNDYQVVSRENGNQLLLLSFKIKQFLKGLIKKHIPKRENAVVQALLLGDRHEIDRSIKEDFSKSGIAHLLAISGLHIGLMAAMWIVLLRFLGFSKRPAYGMTILLLVFYPLLTGPYPSVLRAVFMVSLYLLGTVLKRETEIITSLSWAAIFLLTLNPLQLFDFGFQLSFMAVFILGTAVRSDNRPVPSHFPMQRSSMFSRRFGKALNAVRRFLEASFLVWLGVSPLVAGSFFLVSPVAVLAHLVLIPCFWVVLVNGLAFLIAGSLCEAGGDILGHSLWLFVKILLAGCQWFSQVPYGHFRVAPPSRLMLIAFYGLFLLWIFRSRIGLKRKQVIAIALLIMNGFIWSSVFRRPSPNLRITFLDVGHGDSALIEFPNGGTLLVDTGSGGLWDQGIFTVAPFLWSRGITRLDGILITHPHQDHYGGLSAVLKEFRTGLIFDNGDRSSEAYERVFQETEIPRTILEKGDEIFGIGRVRLKVYHPDRNSLLDPAISPNDQSLVVQLQYGRVKILFCGDAEETALNRISRYGKRLQSQILKVPHHGSDEKSRGESFFSLVKPKIAIISESQKNPFKLPSAKTVRYLEQIGSQIYQTGIQGAVHIITDGTVIEVRKTMENSG